MYTSEWVALQYRRQQQFFHSHSQPFAAAHEQINGWEGTCTTLRSHGHATLVQFRQGDFVDQTQHVKNAFCFCMLRSDIRNSYMLCQKTSASDEAIVWWYLHSYLDKWIQEFQEEEEYSASNGGQCHPKRNKGKGKHISRMSQKYYMLSEKKIQAARCKVKIVCIQNYKH